ncbi:hypothetical protein [Coleofasciculus sp. FACHB-1120]|uniref:hypothetical protein n=1 Tax=Coleofasciculus sp. FACHB-1120 TaxID=2692783 RepID=UPI001687DBEE|nr:hypothetical protein [Coleofasciculus sp. FACHB-1120]MBD2744983.1 hypothetical protein [Coleofasciculus sp. FACHB-1120]
MRLGSKTHRGRWEKSSNWYFEAIASWQRAIIAAASSNWHLFLKAIATHVPISVPQHGNGWNKINQLNHPSNAPTI